jgi:leucine dehydrogenase
MDLFERMQEMGHERVLVCSNPEVGLRAVIAVHSNVLGPGLGGVRMWPYASTDEALVDALRLSRGMTYKAAVAGVQLGGGKAVIIGDPEKDKSEVLFRAFGRAVESLGGRYITAEDVGTNARDMEWIAYETRWVTGLPIDRGGSGDPSPVTAKGTLYGIRASAQKRWGSPSLAGKTVAVQGLGSVGKHLAGFLADEGAKLVGCDIDAGAVAAVREKHGLVPVEPDAIYDVDADVFAPCALGASLNPRTIPRLKSAVVAGAANNQLEVPERDGAALEARGILYAPDFVINAGGLINVYNEYVGYDRERALRQAERIFDNTLRVFEIAESEKIPTWLAGDRLAEERIAAVRRITPRYWERLARERASRPAV